MRWAIIKNHTVENVAIADEAYAMQNGWIPCPDYAGPGWGYVDGTFTEPLPPEIVQPADTTEVLAMLVDTGDISQMSMDKIME